MSVVLRLVVRSLRRGELVGEIEDVVTGQRFTFRSAEELTGLCQSLPSPRLPDAPQPAKQRGRS